MTDAIAPREGGCRCGRIRFAIAAPPLITMACHCRGCQLMTGSAYSLSAAIPAQAFSVIQGEPVIGALHGANRHYYCGWCMSWMFTRVARTDLFVNVRASLIDDPEWTLPFIETCTDEKLPWATTPAQHSFPQFPPEEAYEPLMQEYAAR